MSPRPAGCSLRSKGGLINPTQAAGALATVATLGTGPYSLAFDGARLWSGNVGSISIVTPTVSLPWTVTTVTTGFSSPTSVIHDGANVWVADSNANRFLKLGTDGSILQTVTVGVVPGSPTFDGTNFWVPNVLSGSGSVSVVRASSGAVLATLTGNGLDAPTGAAFDGERILVVNQDGNSVSLWKAADMTTIGTFSTGPGTNPYPPCSDGVSFWIPLHNVGTLARF